MSMDKLSKQIIENAEIIAKIIQTGKSVEIKRNTSGTVKIYEVSKKVR